MSSYIIAGSADSIDTAYVKYLWFLVLRDSKKNKIEV